MSANTSTEYLDTWWLQKIGSNYGVQWKHIAAAELLQTEHFPIVDLGSGTGVFLKLVEDKFPGFSITGLETSAAAIENKICSSLMEQGNIEHWIPKTQVKTVSLIDVIEHIPNPEPLLINIANNCENLLLACPNFNFIKSRWDMLLGRVPFQNRVGRGGHVYWCQYHQLLELLDKVGFRVVRENHLYPRNNNKFLRAMFNIWPSLLSIEFVLILKNTNLDR